MRTIYLLGAPGIGKTTLVRSLLPRLGTAGAERTFSPPAGSRGWNPVVLTPYPERRVLVLGRYDGTPYGGTDRLGMSSGPVARGILPTLVADYPDWRLFGEGDRLANAAFLDAASAVGDLVLIGLEADEAALAARRQARRAADAAWVAGHPTFGGRPQRPERADGQDGAWLRGRETNVRHLLERYGAHVLPYTSLQDARAASAFLLRELGALVGTGDRA